MVWGRWWHIKVVSRNANTRKETGAMFIQQKTGFIVPVVTVPSHPLQYQPQKYERCLQHLGVLFLFDEGDHAECNGFDWVFFFFSKYPDVLSRYAVVTMPSQVYGTTVKQIDLLLYSKFSFLRCIELKEATLSAILYLAKSRSIWASILDPGPLRWM